MGSPWSLSLSLWKGCSDSLWLYITFSSLWENTAWEMKVCDCGKKKPLCRKILCVPCSCRDQFTVNVHPPVSVNVAQLGGKTCLLIYVIVSRRFYFSLVRLSYKVGITNGECILKYSTNWAITLSAHDRQLKKFFIETVVLSKASKHMIRKHWWSYLLN